MGKFLTVLMGVSLLLSSNPVLADKAVAKAYRAADLTAFPWLTEAQYQKQKTVAVQRGSRGVASSSELSDDLLSPEFKAFRTKFFATQTANQLHQLINESDASFDAYPNDLKFFLSNLSVMKTYRGILFRAKPLVSPVPVVHSMILSWLRMLVTSTQVGLPTGQWKAGIAYITEPPEEQVAYIKTEDDLAHFFSDELYPAMLKSATRLQGLNLDKPIIWDNQMLYGTASFQDSLDRYFLIDQAELNAALSMVHGNLNGIAALSAYRISDSFKAMEKLGFLYGFDGFKFGVEGGPARDRVEVIKKLKNYLVLRDPAWMKLSFKHLQESTWRAGLVWQELKDKPRSNRMVFRNAVFSAWNREIDLNFGTMESLMKGKTVVRSAITGETLTVDLQAFFDNPPQDLKALLPTAFEEGPKMIKKGSGAFKGEKYRNYFEGQATAWNVELYKKYFPDLKSSGDIPSAYRILTQAWGGGLPAGALGAAIF